MIKQSLGLIETLGLSAAIEAADTAVKSANVTLVGYEFTNGDGMVVVKLLGEVGAVNAAIDAARVSAANIGRVYATKVIARIGDGIEIMLQDHGNNKTKNSLTANKKVIDSPQKIATINKPNTDLQVSSKNSSIIKSDIDNVPAVDIATKVIPTASKPVSTSEPKTTEKAGKGTTQTKKKK